MYEEINNSISEKARKYLWQFGTSKGKMEKTDGPLIFNRGEGCYIFDVDGNKYLDGLSGAWVINAGHRQAEIISAMVQQMNRLNYALSEEGYANNIAVALAEKLCLLCYGKMNRVYFTCGGSEAVEISLRLARIYHRFNQQKRYKIISRRGSYHGCTLFTITVSDFDILSNSIAPLPNGIAKCAHPYCFRCEFELEYPNCGINCARDFEAVILEEDPDTVAAFIAEPIATPTGIAIPPVEYWREIRRICDKYGVLLIIDEVVTAFGRTGKLFGMENFGVVPDIMIFSKGITSGYAPLGAVLTHQRITQKFPDNAFLMHGYTNTGHPLSCAAAIANINFIINHNLLDNAAAMGERLKDGLIQKIGDHPYVADIRGLGLMVGIEIVKDRKTKRSFAYHDNVSDFLTSYFRENGVYLRLIDGYIHIGPPLIIKEAEIDTIVNVIGNGLNALYQQMR